MLQGLDQLVLGALPRIGSAVVAVGLVLFEDVIDRNQQAVGDGNNGAFVSATWGKSAGDGLDLWIKSKYSSQTHSD